MYSEDRSTSGWQYPLSEDCLSPLEMFQYVEGTLSNKKRIQVETHLATCNTCLNEVTSLVRNTEHPAEDDFEKTLLDSTADRIKNQMSRLNELFDNELIPEDSEKTISASAVRAGFADRKRLLRKGVFLWYKLLKPATAIPLMVLLLLLTVTGIKIYYPKYQTGLAEKVLLSHHFSHIQHPRLSGGYRSSATGQLMSADPVSTDYLTAAELHLKKAQRFGTLDVDGQRLLAQIYMLSEKHPAADSVFQNMPEEIMADPSFLNDRGVFYAGKEDWEEAAGYFKKALLIDAEFPEAYYNLALVDIERNALDEAKLLLELYVQIEEDESWKRAAQHKLSQIKVSKKNEIE